MKQKRYDHFVLDLTYYEYDIVKAHSGKIKVETKDDEGAEFIIQLLII